MGAKQIHDAYGKEVLRRAFNSKFNDTPKTVPFGKNAGSLRIDGTIDEDIAVEVESRTSKQIRGAIVDIVCHPFPKKLVVLINKYGNNYTENQCRELLKRFAPAAYSQVVTLAGSGNDNKFEDDVRIVQAAVKELNKDKPC